LSLLGMHLFIHVVFCLRFLEADQTNSIVTGGIQEICDNLSEVEEKQKQ